MVRGDKRTTWNRGGGLMGVTGAGTRAGLMGL